MRKKKTTVVDVDPVFRRQVSDFFPSRPKNLTAPSFSAEPLRFSRSTLPTLPPSSRATAPSTAISSPRFYTGPNRRPRSQSPIYCAATISVTPSTLPLTISSYGRRGCCVPNVSPRLLRRSLRARASKPYTLLTPKSCRVSRVYLMCTFL